MRVFPARLLCSQATLPTLTRAEASALVEKFGGKVSSSVFKEDELRAGRRGSGQQAHKSQPARHFPVLTEEEFLKLLE